LIEEGSQNVYTDLSCANADAIQRKTMLIVRINDFISAKGLVLHIPAHRDRPFRLNVTACSGLT